MTGVESVLIKAGVDTAKWTLSKSWKFIYQKYKLKSGEKQKLSDYEKNYHSFCKKTLLIKTLASQEKSVFINDIYVPLKLNGSINTVSIEVDQKVSLEHGSRVVLIKGLAGQGKSTILRKLLANNLYRQQKLPIFYELKHYKGGSIEKALSNHLNSIGVGLTDKETGEILNDSYVKLYLDAFDETPPKFRSELLDEISKLINKYNCHVICTSRPDTELDSLTSIDTYEVAILDQQKIFSIIEKTATDKEKAKELCSALTNSPFHNSGSESILKSPILVVLYCVSYNLGQDIPLTLSEFYDNIFETIFFKHDNIKGKVERQRYFNDNRRIYKNLFDYLCFISQRSECLDFTRDSLTKLISDSLRYLNEDPSLSDKITDELISITNLIIEDGYNSYKFIHKSIQEFFTASFISRSIKHEKKLEFYNACSENKDLHSIFNNSLFFLEEIDHYNYYEYFYIPHVNFILRDKNKKIEDDFQINDDLVKIFLQKTQLEAIYKTNYDKRLKASTVEAKLYPLAFTRYYESSLIHGVLFSTVIC